MSSKKLCFVCILINSLVQTVLELVFTISFGCNHDIFQECCRWLHENQFPPTFNTRNIALILKGQKQRSMKECRLIGLCNVLYELASKVLANKLKRVLHKCISNNQHTFFLGRSILDNALVAFEVVHHMKTDRHKSNNNVALKLDISKVYDRIDWVYLKEFMLKMGFALQRVHWILIYVEFVDYSVIACNNMVGSIILGRELCQGTYLCCNNWISMYLFILCAKGISGLWITWSVDLCAHH
jgi:hypothetical protein